ncbi:Rhs element Vgr family protein [Myxococcus stipitatus DSM 14675]|uniref:Rhs element Vgr family protein n=1 Tax=Myxococcus stipitatus (strain DSM 14675 / JCM 12634 / Mx s8) TaxID=1278073 RepID=L7UJG4_MYXSD|nr:type VI secretion system tip protein TssI/VgrG [Myxococcus stipitatus]AGC48148.1 Rhs element Vgr family protein [Myxococcus stipitatus DSM 14675]
MELPAETTVLRATTREALSELFDVDAQFACDTPDLDLAALVGTSGALVLETSAPEEGAEPRCFHGVVEEAEYLCKLAEHGFVYRLRLRPALNGLRYRSRSQIFQQQSAVEIIQDVFKKAGLPAESIEWQLSQDCGKREYCTQWKESDLDFVLRLLEDEGIFFWFEHSTDGHVLKLADASSAYQPISGVPALGYTRSALTSAQTEQVTELVFTAQNITSQYASRDWNWQTPSEPLEAQERASEGGYQRYEYPGYFLSPSDGVRRARHRLSEQVQERMVLEARSNSLRLQPGRLFTVLDALPSFLSQEYFILQVEHDYALTRTEQEGQGANHGTTLRAIPSDGVDFRPPRRTPRPRAWGKESAVVTGPPGEEIHVDEFGRIKVHFYWDREGAVDEKASCWMRVQQQNTSGSMLLPRVGWEVDVGFLNGDPDRPIVLQKLYNQETMPPYGLPAEKTQSSLQSATSPGGGSTNEVRLQDGNGGMELFIHSSKDLKLVTGNDLSEEVVNNAKEEVGQQSTTLVGGNEKVDVGADQGLSVTGNAVLETTGTKTVQVSAVDDWGVTGNASQTVDGTRTDTITGPMNVLANHVLESFNATCDRTVGAALSINSATAIVEAVGGAKDESVAGAKLELLTGAKAEDIGAAKVLTTGVAQFKTGEDIILEAKGAVAITAAGPISEKVGKDFTLTAKTVLITAPGGAKLKGGGKPFELSGSTVTVDAKGIQGKALVKFKGKINYKP